MKFLVPLLLALPLALAPAAGAEESVTVRLVVDLAGQEAGILADCFVTVPEESTAAEVLDQAALDECILEWSAKSYPGLGRYVASIDHVQEAVATYWSFWINGGYSDYGIDATYVAQGDVLRFSYVQWVVVLP